jgi:AcrR family transcriptional regulator
MSRRKYEMGKRAEAVEQTRRRILEATMAVHDEQGIVAGRWPDIADRAGVSLATIYRHFPTLEELVSACGVLTMELVDPPTPESAAETFHDAQSRQERIERLVQATFDFYERAGRIVDNVRRDRNKLTIIGQAHEYLDAGLGALAEEALRPLGATPADLRLTRALLDVRTWEAMRERGLSRTTTVDTAERILHTALPTRPAAAARRTSTH